MPEYLIKIPKDKAGSFLKVVGKLDYIAVKDLKKNIVLKSARKTIVKKRNLLLNK